MGKATVVGHRLEMGERTGQSVRGLLLVCSFKQTQGLNYAAVIAVTAVRIQTTSLHGCYTEPENDYGDKTWA